ncbi:hypothetical protein EPN15_00710 [Patescibacteria group bacterium]|nr:MAG: hypothetical protein EPN15_00710 [Patescibacteria group bacterium]
MLNKERHQLLMGRILKDIYSNTSIAPLLGFKGGTCAYFFYDLPRFSVDLDFDLLKSKEGAEESVFEKIKNISREYGVIKDSYIKRNTIFVLLSYGEADRNIKIEISTRLFPFAIKDFYEIKEYLGISVLAAKKEYLFSGKLAALTLRGETAMRDIYDIYYFVKNGWEIDEKVIEFYTGKKIKEYLNDCVALVEKIKDSEILQGLGELVEEGKKEWIRQDLKNETIFLLKNYMSVIK